MWVCLYHKGKGRNTWINQLSFYCSLHLYFLSVWLVLWMQDVVIFGYSRKDLTDEDLRSIIASTLTCRIDHQYGSFITLRVFLCALKWPTIFFSNDVPEWWKCVTISSNLKLIHTHLKDQFSLSEPPWEMTNTNIVSGLSIKSHSFR